MNEPFPSELTDTGRIRIARELGAKGNTDDDILSAIRAMKYGANQIKLILGDVLRHLNGIDGNVSKAKKIVTERIDFIEAELEK